MNPPPQPSVRPGRLDQADAAAYARFADLASGNGYRRLYGANRLEALAAAYPQRVERTLFLEVESHTAGACGFDTALEAGPDASPDGHTLRTRAVEAWRNLRGIGPQTIAPDELYLAFLAVDASRRRCGFGAVLLRAAENAAQTRGLCRVTAVVDATNHEALKFYAAQGYRQASTQGPIVRIARRLKDAR